MLGKIKFGHRQPVFAGKGRGLFSNREFNRRSLPQYLACLQFCGRAIGTQRFNFSLEPHRRKYQLTCRFSEHQQFALQNRKLLTFDGLFEVLIDAQAIDLRLL